MKWLAERKLTLMKTVPKAMEKAIHYVTSATRDQKPPLRAWDAVHLHYACHLARVRNEQVILVTSDGDFLRVLEEHPGFSRFVSLLDLAAD